MADAVIRGANNEEVDGVEVRVQSALEADADDLLWCDAFILGTPENFGYMSGAMKYFLDRVYYACENKSLSANGPMLCAISILRNATKAPEGASAADSRRCYSSGVNSIFLPDRSTLYFADSFSR